MNYITAIRNLDLDTKQQIKSTRESLQDLYLQFHKLLNPKYATFQHKIVCGYFVSEYVIKLGEISSEDDIDTIFLYARRLLEVLITLKYISQTNTFPKIMEYCQRDRYDYLEGCNARNIADEKLLPELKGLADYTLENKQEQSEILRQYNGKKPEKMPDIKKMAISIGYEEEYNYFYKLTSKMLHFCPFTLNGDTDFSANIHKVVFVKRIAVYLKKVQQELEQIYQSLP